ncbi:chromosome partitioning protein [Micromonospora tulbaghiae]|uniref:Chromosome partitioning protein n=1 Tax=Micromonospora tulbaghiae TaxID=479978 RepID=A0AAW4JM07_9ACTN|nr:chromosome partitioning protein [Micromonospora tulbaghiae]MBO4139976.1 chromosome partitioning protein [Micromonospora tulbaghiae]MDX5456657.1 chromosome partitioning protein [Micromonospora tulbaghiae]SCE65151.1 MinD-like ATPase involved in chromosome partitioning or flagellar assembly [Micromonospora tulbaghiae]
MVHENDDRAHVPGRPQVPQRDVEPLWPPEETDAAAAAIPPWASVPWPLPPADAPTPAAADVPAPPAPAVDLDLPFTLDQATAGPSPAQPVPAASGSPVVSDAPTTPGVPATAGSPATAPVSPPPSTSQAAPAPTTTPANGTTGPGTTGSGSAGEGTGNGRTTSPWAQPPQRAGSDSATTPDPADGTAPPSDAAEADSTASGRATVAPLMPSDALPTEGTATGRAAVAGTPAEPTPESGTGPAGPGEPAPESPPRLGPFPPSPGVPAQPSAYGTGYPSPGYPPQPGQPGYSPQPGQPGYPPQPGQPGWYPPPGWTPQAGVPQPGGPMPPQAPVSGPVAPPPSHQPPAHPEQGWTPQQAVPPTAEDFARRRQARPVDPVATMGVRAVVNKIGLVRLAPGRHEQETKRDIEMVRRNFGGLRQVTVVNPKGGAGKTVAILLLAMTFGQKRGGYVLAWDNNETQGTLGMRAQQDFHARTVRDMLRDLAQFQGPHGRVGDLSQYVRSQGEGMFDVLASDESATGGEMLTAAAFAEIREVVSRFYKLIFVDTGNNVRAQNWQAAMDATDQLVVTMSARNDSAETAARMLDHLEQSGRQRLVRQAVTVVSMPPSRKEIDLPAIQAHFAARTRAVLLAPYERLIDTGEPLRYGQLSSATRDAWLKIAASVAEGL